MAPKPVAATWGPMSYATNLTSTPTTIPDAQSGYRAPATTTGQNRLRYPLRRFFRLS